MTDWRNWLLLPRLRAVEFALSKFELYFRKFLTCPGHTSGMNEEASLQFHIQENDYFGTLATVLDLVSQDLRKKGHHRKADTLGRLRDDLVYLQHSHRIEAIRKRSGSALQDECALMLSLPLE